MPCVTESYGTPYDFIEFFGYFHTLFVCLVNVHIWYVNMPNVSPGYGRFSDLIGYFWAHV